MGPTHLQLTMARAASAALLLCLLCLPGSAAELTAKTAALVDKTMTEEMGKQALVGAALGVIVDGELAYLKGYGLADREAAVPVTRKTLFRWASISKSVTSVAAMQLYEKGLLDLGKDVRTYVPEFPDKKTLITPRDLLCHQGGIVHYTNGELIRTQREYETANPFESVILALDTFKESPLVNQPGEKFSYTTHGFILLSAAIERAGKEKFASQVRNRIILPLGMTTMQPDYQWKTIPNRAVGYLRKKGKVIPSTNTDVSWKLAGGGYISNIDDLAIFARALIHGKLVKPETEKLMWTPQKLKSSKPTTYAYGFSINGMGTKLQVAHNGAQEKTRTRMVIFPRKRFGVVVMSNSEHCNSRKLAGAIVDTFPQLAGKTSVKTSRLEPGNRLFQKRNETLCARALRPSDRP